MTFASLFFRRRFPVQVTCRAVLFILFFAMMGLNIVRHFRDLVSSALAASRTLNSGNQHHLAHHRPRPRHPLRYTKTAYGRVMFVTRNSNRSDLR